MSFPEQNVLQLYILSTEGLYASLKRIYERELRSILDTSSNDLRLNFERPANDML